MTTFDQLIPGAFLTDAWTFSIVEERPAEFVLDAALEGVCLLSDSFLEKPKTPSALFL